MTTTSAGATTEELLEAMPASLKQELDTVAHNAKLQPNGQIKLAKTYNHSNKRTNIFNAKMFLDWIHGQHRTDIRDYKYTEVFDNEEDTVRLILAIHKSTEGAQPKGREKLRISDHLNWSSASGSKIEQARAERYWQLGEKDAHFLRYIRVAQAGEDRSGSLVVYIRCDMNTHTYTLVGPLRNVRPNDVIALLSTVIVESGISLLNKLEKEYTEFIELAWERKVAFDGCVYGAMRCEMSNDGDEYDQFCAYTFQDYIRNIVKEQMLSHMAVRLDNEPVGISSKPGEPTFYFFDKAAVQAATGPTPHWDSWMEVIPPEYHDVFMAWIYSVFVSSNMGRQALWLHSEGYDGKSQMTLALSRFMEGNGVGSINSRVAKSQFAYSAAYGKRLLIFGDCQNDHFLKTSVAHSISGGDPAPVEFKNRDTFTSRVFCKLLICSNKAPQVDTNATHEISRLIYIPLQRPSVAVQRKFLKTDAEGNILYDAQNNPFPTGYNSGVKGEKKKELSDYLFSEMRPFLRKCREKYLKLCPHHKEIITSETVREALYNVCASEPSEEYERYVNDNYEFIAEGEKYEEAREVKHRASEYYGSPRMRNIFKGFRITELMSTFEKIAMRKLRENGTPVAQYKIIQRTVNEQRVRVYPHVRYIGDTQSSGMDITQ